MCALARVLLLFCCCFLLFNFFFLFFFFVVGPLVTGISKMSPQQQGIIIKREHCKGNTEKKRNG